MAHTDVRLTTRWEPDDLAMAFYSCLHEFGHGLYEAQLETVSSIELRHDLTQWRVFKDQHFLLPGERLLQLRWFQPGDRNLAPGIRRRRAHHGAVAGLKEGNLGRRCGFRQNRRLWPD